MSAFSLQGNGLAGLGAERKLLGWVKGWHQPTLQTSLGLQRSSTPWQRGTSPSQPSSQHQHQKTFGLCSPGYFTLWCDSR